MIKTISHPFRKFVFDPTPKRRTSAPWVICGPSQNLYDCEKKFGKFTEVFEKIRVKDFSMGAIPPQRGEAVEKKNVSYMGALE